MRRDDVRRMVQIVEEAKNGSWNAEVLIATAAAAVRVHGCELPKPSEGEQHTRELFAAALDKMGQQRETTQELASFSAQLATLGN